MDDGIELIAQERQKQLISERNTSFDVAYNTNNELISAIMLLAASIGFKRNEMFMPNDAFDELRPDSWDKGRCMKYVNRSEIDQLKIIGAFAAAEIDRLQSIKA